MAVDFGRTARDYAAYRTEFPPGLFTRVLRDRFPAEPLTVPHRIWGLVARSRG